jgi:hypothetical protein
MSFRYNNHNAMNFFLKELSYLYNGLFIYLLNNLKHQIFRSDFTELLSVINFTDQIYRYFLYLNILAVLFPAFPVVQFFLTIISTNRLGKDY